MLPKNNRLPLRFSRNYLESEGKPIHTPLFTLVFAKSMLGEDASTRFGFIVSKKISRSAVDRNLIKRRLVGCLIPLLSTLKSGFDVLLYIKTPISSADTETISTNLSKALKRAKITL